MKHKFKLIRPAKLDSEGEIIPPLIQLDGSTRRSPLAIGVLLVLLFLIGSAILMGIFSFYDRFFTRDIYQPDYIYLRDNLTMPDGRRYWDNNNKTDMLIAAMVLEDYLNEKFVEKNYTNTTVEEFLAASQPVYFVRGGAGKGGGGK